MRWNCARYGELWKEKADRESAREIKDSWESPLAHVATYKKHTLKSNFPNFAVNFKLNKSVI